MAYHKADIKKGVTGEASKIREELDELVDAEEQGNRILMLVELSDIVAAVINYADNKFEEIISIEDIVKMAKATNSAFEDGTRK